MLHNLTEILQSLKAAAYKASAEADCEAKKSASRSCPRESTHLAKLVVNLNIKQTSANFMTGIVSSE